VSSRSERDFLKYRDDKWRVRSKTAEALAALASSLGHPDHFDLDYFCPEAAFIKRRW
jgi:hypothetical protein